MAVVESLQLSRRLSPEHAAAVATASSSWPLVAKDGPATASLSAGMRPCVEHWVVRTGSRGTR